MNAAIATATAADLPRLAGLGAEFYAEGRLPGRFEPKVFQATWEKMLSTGAGVIFTLAVAGRTVGFIGGVAYRDANDGDLVASEFFWFVTKEHRGLGGVRLLDAFESWAKESGCRRVNMVHLQNLNPDGLRAFYERRGFRHVESHYLKEI